MGNSFFKPKTSSGVLEAEHKALVIAGVALESAEMSSGAPIRVELQPHMLTQLPLYAQLQRPVDPEPENSDQSILPVELLLLIVQVLIVARDFQQLHALRQVCKLFKYEIDKNIGRIEWSLARNYFVYTQILPHVEGILMGHADWDMAYAIQRVAAIELPVAQQYRAENPGTVDANTGVSHNNGFMMLSSGI